MGLFYPEVCAASTTKRKPDLLISDKLLLSPTAFSPNSDASRYRYRWTSVGIFYNEFSYSPSEKVTFGGGTILPIGIVMGNFFATIYPNLSKITKSKYFKFALRIQGGGGFLVKTPSDTTITGLFLTPIITIGTRRYFFNFSIPSSFISVVSKKKIDPVGFLTVPSLGGAIALSNRLQLLAELIIPIGIREDETESPFALVSYGFRYSGEHFFGSLYFNLPITKNSMDDFFKVFPLGFPMFNLGYRW